MTTTPIRVYVAGGLETAPQVRALMDLLRMQDVEITYDWTTHGAVDPDRCQAVAEAELDGVIAADAVVVRLPGGSGTHVELGAALATSRPVLILLDHVDRRRPSFYSHELVTIVARPDTAEDEAAAVMTWLRLLPTEEDEELEDLWSETAREWSAVAPRRGRC